MNKRKKCKCIENYKVKVLIHETKKHNNLIIFNKGEELYYRYEDGVYFIAKDGYKLSKVIYYSTDIEDIDIETFNKYFQKII